MSMYYTKLRHTEKNPVYFILWQLVWAFEWNGFPNKRPWGAPTGGPVRSMRHPGQIATVSFSLVCDSLISPLQHTKSPMIGNIFFFV